MGGGRGGGHKADVLTLLGTEPGAYALGFGDSSSARLGRVPIACRWVWPLGRRDIIARLCMCMVCA